MPQGSVLGPVLFSLVFDSFSSICNNTSVVKYADDLSILYFVRTSIDDNLQTEWDSLIRWSESVSLPINYDKCSVMDIVTKSSLRLNPVSCNDTSALNNVTVTLFRF